MSELTKSMFNISEADIIRKTSQVKQLVDFLQIDVSSVEGNEAPTSSTDTKTRKKYEVFVTGSDNYAVTSSLFQTVFDQDFTTQTSNELFDITIGCYEGSQLVDDALDKTAGLNNTGIDASGKKIFPNTVLMVREKINIYKQYAQALLGDSSGYFTSPYEASLSSDSNERIDEAIFINIKRLFTRDSIVKDQFAMKLFKTLASTSGDTSNIDIPATGEVIITDTDASTSLRVTSQAGSIGTLTDGTNNVGLIFYEKGIVILNARKVFDLTGNVKGTFQGGNAQLTFGDNDNKKLVPDLWVSASVDRVIDHICNTRFGRSASSAMGFLNQTNINSSIYVCRVAPSQANYSRNPTYTDTNGKIRVIENKGDDPFSYITTIGLYDTNNNLLAVAKTSRPIEKNPEVDLSISVRIDY